jgi:hypothetical protein
MPYAEQIGEKLWDFEAGAYSKHTAGRLKHLIDRLTSYCARVKKINDPLLGKYGVFVRRKGS